MVEEALQLQHLVTQQASLGHPIGICRGQPGDVVADGGCVNGLKPLPDDTERHDDLLPNLVETRPRAADLVLSLRDLELVAKDD